MYRAETAMFLKGGPDSLVEASPNHTVGEACEMLSSSFRKLDDEADSLKGSECAHSLTSVDMFRID